jgi:hypothetical protein
LPDVRGAFPVASLFHGIGHACGSTFRGVFGRSSTVGCSPLVKALATHSEPSLLERAFTRLSDIAVVHGRRPRQIRLYGHWRCCVGHSNARLLRTISLGTNVIAVLSADPAFFFGVLVGQHLPLLLLAGFHAPHEGAEDTHAAAP